MLTHLSEAAPVLQAHASAAIVNFTEGCESDLLPDYLDQLIQKLLELAGKGAKTVKVSHHPSNVRPLSSCTTTCKGLPLLTQQIFGMATLHISLPAVPSSARLSNNSALQEGALTALASVADASKQYFIKYYDHVMPLLRGILSSGIGRDEALLRAKALECISLVGMAVGKERFREDAHRVMELIRQLQVGSCMPLAMPLAREWTIA